MEPALFTAYLLDKELENLSYCFGFKELISYLYIIYISISFVQLKIRKSKLSNIIQYFQAKGNTENTLITGWDKLFPSSYDHFLTASTSVQK